MNDLEFERKVSFLLGAGASAEAGMPTMAELGRKFCESLPVPELRHQVQLFSEGINDWHLHTNVEALLSEMLRLQADKQASPVVNRTAAILGFEAKKYILRALSRAPKDTAYLNGIRRWINGRVPLDVFTLNYDVVFETWCDRQRMSWTDGCHADGVWTPESLTGNHSDVRLWKLHGSVNWLHEGDSVRCAAPLGTLRQELRSGELRSRALDAAVIYPAARKKAFEVLSWMQAAFAGSLASLRLLVCVGYGFADKHIADAVKNALVHYPNFHLIICDPNPQRPL